MIQKKEPLISVIMPVFNAEHYVGEAIESILNQTHQNLELLVLDDASTDESLRIVRSFSDSRIRLYQNNVNQGYLKSVNRLFSECRGEFIGFQDADDWSDPSRIENQFGAFERDPDLTFCGTQCIHIKNGKEVHRSNFPIEYERVITQVERGDTVFLCGASVIIKAELLKKYGGYRDFFDQIGGEDIDWALRMLSVEKYENLPNYLYKYRLTYGSISRKLDLQPLKYHCRQIALLTYWQRKLTGSDALDNERRSIELATEIKKWYDDDKSLIYRRAGVNQLAFRHFNGYARCITEAFRATGITWNNIKLMIVGVPLFIFLSFVPKKLQRSVVARNNRNFLKKMGIDLN